MSTMTVTISGGDNSSAQDSGQILAPQSLSTATSNFARINAAAVPHNSSVTATAEPSAATFDVVIDPNTYDFTKILAIILTCKLTALNANTLVPQVYVKLTNAAGSSHPLVIPLIPGQSFAYVNPAIVGAGGNTPNTTNDVNGAAMALTSVTIILPTALAANIATITCTPDKFSDVSISGTIEYLT